MKVRVKLNSEKKTLKNVDIETGTGQATVIKHPANGVYTFQLIDLATNLGPQKIIAKRVGNNLEIAFDDSKSPDLIIENYYRDGKEESPIIGLAEDGQYYAYIPENGLADSAIPALKENVLATEVLGGEGFVAAALPFALSWPWILGGLGLLGTVAALSSGGGSSGGSNSPSLTNIALTPKDNGGFEFTWPEGAKKVEVTLYPEGSKKPVVVTLTKNEDGSISSDNTDLIPNVAKDQPVVIPADKVKDNSPVDIKAFNENGTAIAEGKGTTDYDVDSTPATIEKVSPHDADGDGKADRTDLELTGPKGAPFEVKDKNGNVIAQGEFDLNGKAKIPVPLDPNNPARDAIDDLTVVVKENGKNPAETPVNKDTAKVVEDLDTPNNTFVPTPELKPSENPADPENSFEVDVKLDDKENTKEIKLDVVDPETGKVTDTITLTKDEKGEFKGPEGVKVENTEDGVKVTLPKDKVPEKSQITASTTNNAGETSAPSTPVENKGGEEGLKPVDPESLKPSTQPTIESIKSIDTSSPADNNPEEFVVSGTAAPGSSVTIYGEKDGVKTPIGSTTADENGKFTVTVTDQGKGVDLMTGDKISVEATEPGKKPTAAEAAQNVPEVPAGKEGHPLDSVKPEAKVEINTHNEPGSQDGSAEIDTTGMKPGDKLVVGITTENDENKTLEFTMGEDGRLTPSENNDPALADKVKVDGGKVTIDESALKDGEDISAKVVDIAGNETTTATETAGFDDATTKPTEVTIKAIDTDSPANSTPEKLEATVKGAKEGDTVIFRDENGEKIAEVKLTPEMKQEDGSFKVPVTLEDAHKDVKEVSVTVQEPGKGESEATKAEVPAVAEGKEGHPNDKLPPKAPNVSSDSENVTVNGIDPENTDKLTIAVTPKGDNAGAPVEVVYTKQPDGSFTPDEAHKDFPTIPAGATSVDIPRELLPKGQIDVVAKAEDLANNASESPSTPVKPLLEQSSPVKSIDSIKATDDNETADKNPENFVIKGKAEPGADVIATAKDKNGKDVELGRATADKDGNFTIFATDKEKGVDVQNTNEITVVAKEPGKRASEPTPVESVPTSEISHPNDDKAPAKPIEVPVSAEKPSDKKVELSPETEKATVEYIDNNGNPQTATITRDEAGKLQSDNPNVTVDGNVITIKGDATKDNTPIKVTPTDLAGNDGEPLVIGSGSDTPVIKEQPEAPVVNKDGSVEVPEEAGSVTITKDGKDIVVPRGEDGNLNPPKDSGYQVDPNNPNKLVPTDPIQPGTNVSATVTGENGEKATDTETVANPNAPVVNKDGSVEVPAGSNSVTIQKDKGEPVEIPRNEKGELVPPADSGFKVDPTNPNKLVPTAPIKPGTEITAETTGPNGEKLSDKESVADPNAPVVNKDGSVEVAPGHNATITVGDKEPVTIPRNEKGELVPPADSGFKVDPENPNKLVPTNPIEPGTKVEVTTEPSPKLDSGTISPTVNPDGSVEVPAGSGTVTIQKGDGAPVEIPRNEKGELVPPADSGFKVDPANPNKLVPTAPIAPGTEITASVPGQNGTPATDKGTVADPKAPVVGEDGSITAPEGSKDPITITVGDNKPVTIPRNEKGELVPPADSGFKVDPTNPNKLVPTAPIAPGTDVTASVPSAGSDKPATGTNTVVDPEAPQVDNTTGSIDVPAGKDVIVKVGDKEPEVIKRDPETGKLQPGENSDFKVDPNDPNKLVPKEPIPAGTKVEVTTEDTPKGDSETIADPKAPVVGEDGSVTVPEGTTGSVTIEVEGKDPVEVPIVDGKPKPAEGSGFTVDPTNSNKLVPTTPIEPGKEVTATIPSTDGNKPSTGSNTVVDPKAPVVGEDGSVTVPEGTTGPVTIDVGGNKVEVPIVDGKPKPTEGSGFTVDPANPNKVVPTTPIKPGTDVTASVPGAEGEKPKTDTNTVTDPEAPKVDTTGSIDVPAGKDVIVKVGDKEPEVITRDPETGKLQPGENSDFKVDPNDPNKLVPKEPIPAGTNVSVTVKPTPDADKSTATGEVEQPTPVVPSKPEVSEQPNAANPAIKDVVVELPTDAKVGDKVNVTYTPAPTAENPNPAPVVETLTKTEKGWEKQPDSKLPDVSTNEAGQPVLVIPGTSVKDGSPVIVNAENAAGTGRTEDDVLENTNTDGDGKQPEAVEKLATPTDLVLESVDNRQGGADRTEANPDSFTLTGKVPGAPAGTEVLVKVGEEVVGKGKTDDKGNFSIEFTDNKVATDIANGTNLTVTAQKPGEPATASETPATVTVKDVERADNTPPSAELAPTEGGAIVTPNKPLNPGDEFTVKVTPPATEGNANPQPTEHTYVVNEEGNLVPKTPETSPAVNPDGTIFVPATPGSTVEVATKDTAGNTNVTKPTPSGENNGAGEGTGEGTGEGNGTGPSGDNSSETPVENPNTIVIPGKPSDKPLPTEKTEEPTDLAITHMKDKNNPADGNPETFTVTGKVPGATVGTEVKVFDEKGNLLGTGKTTDKEGNFEVVATENPNKDLDTVEAGKEPVSKLVVQAQDKEGNKLPSTSAELPITGKVDQFGDNQAPEKPHVVASTTDGSVILTLPKDAHPGDTVVVELTPAGQKDPVKVTLEKLPDGSWTSSNRDLVPDAIDEQPSITIPEAVIADNTPVKAYATDIAGNNQDGTVADSAIAGGDKLTTAVPTELTVQPLDTDAVPDDRVDAAVVTGKTEPNATVTIKDGNEVIGTVTADSDGNFKAIIAKPDAELDKLKAENPNVPVITSENGVEGKELGFSSEAPNKKTSVEVKETIPALTKTPVVNVDAVDTDEVANKEPDVVYISGTTDPNAVVTIKDGNNNPIGTVTADENGNFEALIAKPNAKHLDEEKAKHPGLAENEVFTADNLDEKELTFTAQAEGKAPSSVKEGSVPALDANNQDHPYDTAAPEAPVVKPSTTPNDGSVTVGLPESAAPGDKAEVTYTDEQNTPVTVVYEKQPDGTWKFVPAEGQTLPTGLPETIENGTNSLTIPEENLKDDSPVNAKLIDVAGKETAAESQKAPFDDVTATPTITEVDAVDTDRTANSGVDTIRVKGTAQPGADVAIKAEDGTVLGTVKADPNGNFEVILAKPNAENLDNEKAKHPGVTVLENVPGVETAAGKPISVTATEPAKGESAAASQPVPVLTLGSTDHPYDKEAPNPPKLTASTDKGVGTVTLEAPDNAQAGDKIVVTFSPEVKAGEQPRVVEVELTKQADGSWTSSDNLIPGIPAGQKSVVIPEDSLKDLSTISAKSKDPVGNISASVDAVAPYDEVTTLPHTLAVDVMDSDNQADRSIDFVTVTGKTDANAVVTITQNQGGAQPVTLTKEATPVTANATGDFKVIFHKAGAENLADMKTKNPGVTFIEVANPDALVKAGNTGALTVTAKEPTKAVSDDATVDVPALASTAEDHPYDTTPPSAPTLEAVATGATSGSVKVKFPAANASEAGDKVALTFTPEQPENSAPVTVVYEKQTDGTWAPATPEDAKKATDNHLPNSVPAADPTMTIPQDSLKDRSDVTAVATDNAGQETKGHAVNSNGQPIGADGQPVTGDQKPAEKVVAPDDKTATPIITKVEAINKDTTPSGTTPKSVRITGEVEDGVTNATIKVVDKDGRDVTDVSNITVTPKEGKNIFTLDIDNLDGANADKGPFKVIATAGAKPPSDPSDAQTVPTAVERGTPTPEALAADDAAAATNKGGFVNDSTNPTAPTFEKPTDVADGGMKVNLDPTNANTGDRVIVEYTDEQNHPQKVVVEKTANGWNAVEPATLPTGVTLEGNKLKLDESILKDGEKVSARTQDLAGNISEKAKSDATNFDSQTEKPTLTATVAYQGDTPAVILSGTAEPNSTVTFYGQPANAAKPTALNGVTVTTPAGTGATTSYKAVLVPKNTPENVKAKLKEVHGVDPIEVDTLPAAGTKLTAKAQHKAGDAFDEALSAASTEATLESTANLRDVTHYSVDTSTTADKNPEQWVVEGKAEAGATVYLKDKNGNIIASTTATGDGSFKFTVTEGKPTAGAMPTNGEVTVTELETVAGSNYSLFAKGSARAYISNAVEKAPTEVGEGTHISKIAGSNIEAESVLFNGNQAKTQDSDYTANTITVDKSTATEDQKLTESPENYFLLAKEKQGSTDRPFVSGDFTYTSAGHTADKNVNAHTGDNVAPTANIEVLAETSGNTANRKAGATQANNANFGFKVTTDKTVEGDTITVVRYKAGSGVNAADAANNEKAVYKFTNGAWTLVSDTDNLSADGATVVATVAADNNKATAFTFTPSANLVNSGDLFVVTYKDFAGNAKQAMKVVQPEMLFDGSPETADVPDVFVGTISNAAEKNKSLNGSSTTPITPNKDKFVVTGADNATNSSVNSGDVVFRPGKDNVKMEISYIASDAQVGPDGEVPVTVIYGQLQPENGASNRATDIFKFYTASGSDAPELPEGTIRKVVGEDGSYYYVLSASKVKDATSVSVVGIDGAEKRSDAEPTPPSADQAKKVSEVLAGFDDKTDSAVGTPEVSQANANADIAIKPTSAPDTDSNAANDNDNADTVAYVVTFDATHLSKASTKAYGLNAVDNPGAENQGDGTTSTHGNPQGVNHIVVSRNAEGKWSANLVKGEGTADGGKSDKLLADALSDALNGNSAANDTSIRADIGTLEPTGIFKLNKDLVKGGSVVTVKAIDAYGNTASKEDFTTVHSTSNEAVITDQPVITDLGFGNAHVDFGSNNDKLKITGFSTEANEIEVTRNSRSAAANPTDAVGPEFSIRVGGQTLNTDELAAKGIVFDENTGRVTLKTPTDNNDIIVTGYRQDQPSRPIIKVLDKSTDPTPDSVDEIDNITALEDGSVSFKPGVDNTKLTVKYTKENGTSVEVVLNKTGDTWAPAPGHESNATDFDFTNAGTAGVIKLNPNSVKDMTRVEVIGANEKGLTNQGSNTFAGRDDTTHDTAVAPQITEIQATPTKENLPKVTPGDDNNRVDITFTPKADSGATPSTISAVLKPGGWDLVDANNRPVDNDIARIDPETGVVTINTPLQGGTTVSAVGRDPHLNAANSDKTVPQAGTAGNPEIGNGSNAGSTNKPEEVDPTHPDYRTNFPAFLQKDNDGYAEVRPVNGGKLIFNVVDMTTGQPKALMLSFTRDSATYSLGNPISRNRVTDISGKSPAKNITDPELAGFITRDPSGKFIIKSNNKFRLIADSPREPQDDPGYGHNDLSVASVASNGQNAYESAKYTTGGKYIGYAINETKYKPDPSLPKSEPFVLEAPQTGDKQGAVIIKPKPGVEYTYPVVLSVQYVDETGKQQATILSKDVKTGTWTVDDAHSIHFDLTQENPMLKADALEDKHVNGVSVRVIELGKRYSDWDSATPWLDPEPATPAVENSDLPTAGNTLDSATLDTSNPRNSAAADDILARAWPNRVVRSDGLNEIAKNMKGLTITSEKGKKTVITANEVDGNNDNTLVVNGSVGDTAPGIFKFPRQDIEINMGAGNDVLAVKNHLGDYKGHNTINLGDGSDLLTVGGGHKTFKLYENKDETDPTKRFSFDGKGKGATPLNGLEQNDGYEHGGVIVNTTINGGAGNDVIAVEGDVRDNRSAIGHGAVLNLGDGHDAVIIAPNNANSTSQRGEIAEGAVVDFGSGNDYLNAVGIRGGAKIDMGADKDTVVVDRILSSNTVLNMGAGDDIVKIGDAKTDRSGEARDGAQINLGEGNDTLHFRASSNLWGKSTDQEARFMAKLDGGAGYDTFVLETPDQINVGSVYKHNISHLSTKYIKNIEEVQMSKGTAFDISIGDLWNQASGVLRINALGPDSDPLRPVNDRPNMGSGKGVNRLVDLGETNANTGTETYPTGSPGIQNGGKFNGYDRVGSAQGYWAKVSGVTHTEKAIDSLGHEHEVIYDVYRFANDARYEVWIQQGIQVI